MTNKNVKKNTVQEKTAEKGAGNFGASLPVRHTQTGATKISRPQTQTSQLPDGWIETTLGEVVKNERNFLVLLSAIPFRL